MWQHEESRESANRGRELTGEAASKAFRVIGIPLIFPPLKGRIWYHQGYGGRWLDGDLPGHAARLSVRPWEGPMMKYSAFVLLILLISVPAAAHWFMERHDANGDGRVTRQEFQGSTERFRSLDTNRDGKITLREAPASRLRVPARVAPGRAVAPGKVVRPGRVVRPADRRGPGPRVRNPNKRRVDNRRRVNREKARRHRNAVRSPKNRSPRPARKPRP